MDWLKDWLREVITSNKTWIIAPFLAMNGTLSLLESLQRLVCFEEEKVVGTVSTLYMIPIRSTKLLRVPTLQLNMTSIHRNKQIAIYETANGTLKKMAGNRGPCETYKVESRFEGDDKLWLSYRGLPDLLIQYSDFESNPRMCITEADGRDYIEVGEEADQWFGGILGREVKLLYCPRTTLAGEWNFTVYRAPDRAPAPTCPLLLLSQATVDQVSEDAGYDVELERFRPNIVVGNCCPGDEELWGVLRIGHTVEVEQVFLNPRCGVVNALGGTYSAKTMDTIMKHAFRDERNRACMGVYFRVLRPGRIVQGDKIILLRRQAGRTSGTYSLPRDVMIGF